MEDEWLPSRPDQFTHRKEPPYPFGKGLNGAPRRFIINYSFNNAKDKKKKVDDCIGTWRHNNVYAIIAPPQ